MFWLRHHSASFPDFIHAQLYVYVCVCWRAHTVFGCSHWQFAAGTAHPKPNVQYNKLSNITYCQMKNRLFITSPNIMKSGRYKKKKKQQLKYISYPKVWIHAQKHSTYRLKSKHKYRRAQSLIMTLYFSY